MRKIMAVLALMALLPSVGCGPAEKTARDVISSATGAISSAQVEYKAECTTLPTAPKCVLINDAVHAQNAAITALEAYCGFAVGVSLPGDKCAPVSTATGALTASLANLKNFTGEITAILANHQNKVAKAARVVTPLDRARDTAASIASSTPRLPTFAAIEHIRIKEAL